ncbi:uncharacterized protein LOC132549793 isoform X2 [Ylistrum balloti]|uniref:uncharacterized protein LOC132549793 isoform X2 n=1 Tax=Ylistrum balloti TaxID=509963 RepID=UPI002905E0C3|nr:uncharacterized protein LOC132549793 isoform X2 [Ylistrum balloti]
MNYTKELDHSFKIFFLLMEFGTKVLRKKLENELSKLTTTFQDMLNVYCHDLIHLYKLKHCCACTSYPTRRKSVFTYKQLMMLFLEDRNQTCTRPNEDRDQFCICVFKRKSDIAVLDLDITLLSCFLINIIKLDETDKILVEKLRDERNGVLHGNLTTLPTEEFERRFQKITHIINEIAKRFDKELFETLWHQMLELGSSKWSLQRLPTAKELDVKSWHARDAQTSTETRETRNVELHEYLRNINLEDLREFPDQVRKKLKEIVISPTLTSGLRSEIEFTNMTLEQHVSPENVFHATQQLQDSFHVFYTKHVLVLCGIAGSGKTTIAYEVMYHRREEYTPIILSNPDQLKFVSPSDKVLIFLDDILGRSAYSRENALKWYSMFKTMHTLSRQSRSRFVLAFRENVYEDFRQDMDVFHNMLFSDDHLVNVSCMSLLEKEAMLEKYCCENGVSIHYGNVDDSTKNSSRCLDKKTFNQICITEPLTGFPQSCFLFFSNENFFKLGQEFFRRPDKSLISKVDKLRKSGDKHCRLQYAVLVYMMLVDETMDLTSVAECPNFQQITIDLDLKSATYSELLDCVEDDTVRSLLRVHDQNTVTFRHQTVNEAVFISFSVHFPDKIFQSCKLQFIKDFLRSRTYERKKGEVVVTIQERCFTTLSYRLIDEVLRKNNYQQCMQLQVFEDSGFTKNFVDSLQTELKNATDLNEVIMKLLLCSSEQGKHELLSELLQLCDVFDDDYCGSNTNTTNKVNISMTYYREEILSTAIRKGHVKTISSIVKKERKVLYRSKCGLLPIHTAIWTGIRPVCDVLWNEYGNEIICTSSFNDTSGRRCIHYCAMRGYIDKIREIKAHGVEFVLAKDARNLSALHYAAHGGQYQIFHELIKYGLCITERTKDNDSVLQVLLKSLDYDERCNIVPPLPQDIMKAISAENSVLWNNDYYKTLECILEMDAADPNDLDVIINTTHSYNVAHYACIDDACSVVSLLLSKRRVLFLQRNCTNLPMTWDIAAFLGRFSILKTFLEYSLVPDTDRANLLPTAKKGRKQAEIIRFKDRRLLLNRYEREKIWPGCCFPFVIFGQESDYDDIEKLLM